MWQPIGTVPVNTWVLARMRRENGSWYIPAVAQYNTEHRRWLDPSDVLEDGGITGDFHFHDSWWPDEWHPLPEENAVVEPLELANEQQ